MPGMGGLSTIPGRIVDALTGLLGAPGESGGLDGTPDLDLPQRDPIDHAEPADPSGDERSDDDTDDLLAGQRAEDAPADTAPGEHPAEPEHPTGPEYPAEAAQPPPAAEQALSQGDPPAEEVPATMSPPAPQQATPCEIAADELPHVGE